MSENLSITENAAKRIEHLLKSEAEGAYLRVAVDGGGCNGFQYRFDFDTKLNEDDIKITRDGAKVIIDETSLEFVKGSVIDYVVTLGASAFEIKNPNAASSCGCGNSFSV
jgi:iron-sulfur cluster assembly protein